MATLPWPAHLLACPPPPPTHSPAPACLGMPLHQPASAARNTAHIFLGEREPQGEWGGPGWKCPALGAPLLELALLSNEV